LYLCLLTKKETIYKSN